MLAAFVIIAAVVVLLAGSACDLWTDAIRYKSIGFDGVFWTRLGSQAGLFVAAMLVSLVFLLADLAGGHASPRQRTRNGRAVSAPSPTGSRRPSARPTSAPA